MTVRAAERLRIVVTGLVGQYPVGGVAWDYLQYVIGLHRLGHDVYYHEDTWSWPFDPVRNGYVDDASYSVAFLDGFFRRHAPELSDRWHYRHLHGSSHGMTAERFSAVAGTADLFLNVSGASMLPDELLPSCRTVFVDTDPGYNQIVLVERPEWSENVERWCEGVRAHDAFFSYGESIGSPDSTVPTADLPWRPTRMPVVIDLWEPAGRPEPDAPWTTVMTWSAFRGPLTCRGKEYSSKGAEFERLLDVPAQVSRPMAVAVGGTTAPMERLVAAGWQVGDAPSATRTPEAYQELIRSSYGEFSCAKQVYVALRTGWFSTRSACYLAAGRPVVVQDTGFSAHVPVGAGLLAFDDVAGALECLEEVAGDWDRHAAAAREVAAEHFAAERVLGAMVDELAGVMRIAMPRQGQGTADPVRPAAAVR